MSGSGRQPSVEDVRRVFTEVSDPGEPLATSDIAQQVNCDRQTADALLQKLNESGDIESKRIGAQARVWWRPPSVTDSESDRTAESQHGAFPGTPDATLAERILEACPVGIVTVDASGEIVFANGRAAEILGFESDQVTSRTYREPDWNISYDDGTPVPVEEHPVTRVLETGAPEFGFEHWIEHPDGSERWLSSNSVAIVGDDGDFEYVVVGFEDATPLKEREEKLTSDHYRELELRSDELFEQFLDTMDGPFTVAVDEVVTLPDQTTLQYLTATGMSARAVSDVFESRAGVRNVRLLSSAGERSRIEVHVDRTTLPVIFDTHGGTVTILAHYEGEGRPLMAGELPGDADHRAVIRECRRVYPDLELASQDLRYTPRLLAKIVEDVLTDRQFAALKTAYYGGYFDTPKRSTGDELAARLGITRQTFNQHRRKAERTVFEQVFEASGERAR